MTDTPLTAVMDLSKREMQFVAVLVLGILCLLIYARTLNHGFVNYDDPKYVTENIQVRQGLTREGLSRALTTTSDGNWVPLTWVSHMLDVTLYGLNPAGHHATNLVLHLANTILLFLALSALTGATLSSALVAALFAVHPLHVESVAWIAERKDVLSTFFAFLTVLLYARYVRRPNAGAYAGMLGCFALGLMAKSMIVTLPCILLLFDFWPLGRMQAKNGDQTAWIDPRKLPSLPMEKAPLFVMAGAICAVTVMAQAGSGGVKDLVRYPIGLRVGNALVSYADYLVKTVWPFGLAVFYPHPGHALSLGRIWGAAGFLVLVSLGVLGLGKRHAYLPLGWCWYLGTLVPVIGLVQVGSQAMADRYTYLPLIGIFIMGVWGARDLMLWRPRLRPVAALVAVGLVAGLTLQAYRQAGYWHDSVRLFEHALAVTKNNGVAHTNLGSALLDLGKLDRAEVQCRKALDISPGNSIATLNMGLVFEAKKDLTAARTWYRKTLALDPENVGALNGLGNLAVARGRRKAAGAWYEKVLRIRPGSVEANNNLGNLFLLDGRFAEAQIRFATALETAPDDPGLYLGLGMAQKGQGNMKGALAAFARAIELDPGLSTAYAQIGALLLDQGRPGGARRFAQKALALAPGNTEALGLLERLGSHGPANVSTLRGTP